MRPVPSAQVDIREVIDPGNNPCGACGYAAADHLGGEEKCPTGDKRPGHFRPRAPVAPPDPHPALFRAPGGLGVLVCYPMRIEWELARAAAERAADVVPPLVYARPPAGAAEVAPKAVAIGSDALARSWAPSLAYSVAGDGTETSRLTLTRPPLQAVALWHRDADKRGTMSGWRTGGAYAWRSDVEGFPVPVGITRLVELIGETE